MASSESAPEPVDATMADEGAPADAEALMGESSELVPQTIPAMLQYLRAACVHKQAIDGQVAERLLELLRGVNEERAQIVAPRLARVIAELSVFLGERKDARSTRRALLKGAGTVAGGAFDAAAVLPPLLIQQLTSVLPESASPAALFSAMKVTRDALGTFAGAGEGAPAWLPAMVAFQGELLAGAAAAGPKAAPVLERMKDVAATGMRAGDGVLAAYVSAFCEGGALEGRFALLGAVAACSRAEGALWEGRLRPWMLEAYLQDVWAQRAVRAPWQLDAFAALLETLSAAEVAERIVPAADQHLKKAPEAALAALAHLAEALDRRVDLSDALRGVILPAAMKHLRSDKDDLRSAAGDALCAVARLCRSGEALAAAVGEMAAVLGGRDGPLQQWYLRQGMVVGLAAVLRSCAPAKDEGAAGDDGSWGAAWRQECARVAAGALVDTMAREAHEETLLRAREALGAALAMLEDAACVASALSDIVGSSSAASSSALQAAALSLQLLEARLGAAAACSRAGMRPALEAEVAAGGGKAGAQPKAVMAASMLLQLEMAAAASGAAFEAAPAAWAAFSERDSFVFASNLLGARGESSLFVAPIANAPALCAACHGVAAAVAVASRGDAPAHASSPLAPRRAGAGALGLPAPAPAAVLLARCAASADEDVRGAALEAMRVAMAATGGRCGPQLLAGVLRATLSTGAYLRSRAFEADAEALEEAEAARRHRVRPQHFRSAVAFALGAEVDESPNPSPDPSPNASLEEALPGLLLLAHHPVLLGAKVEEVPKALRALPEQRRGHYWLRLLRRCGLHAAPYDSLELAERTAAALVGACRSEDVGERCAARAAIATLSVAASGAAPFAAPPLEAFVRFAQRVAFSHALPLLAEQLSAAADALPEDDQWVYLHPSEAEAREREREAGGAKRRAAPKPLAGAPAAAAKAAARRAPRRRRAARRARPARRAAGRRAAARRRRGAARRRRGAARRRRRRRRRAPRRRARRRRAPARRSR